MTQTISPDWKAHVDVELAALRTAIDANTVITMATSSKIDAHTERTKPVMEAIDAMQAGVRVLGWLGKLITWGAPIAAAIATVIGVWKGWFKP